MVQFEQLISCTVSGYTDRAETLHGNQIVQFGQLKQQASILVKTWQHIGEWYQIIKKRSTSRK